MELEWKRSALKPLLNSVLGENLEDLHWKKECQQSAQPQTLLSPVLGETLENDHDDHEEQEWKRAAQQSAAGERQQTIRSALPPTVPPAAEAPEASSAAGWSPG